jgi:hypothetical protein
VTSGDHKESAATVLEKEGLGMFEDLLALVAGQLTDRLVTAEATASGHTSLRTLAIDQEATTP